MSRSQSTLRSLQRELDSLVATLIGEAEPDAVNVSVARLETALDATTGAEDPGIVSSAEAEVRSAIDLARSGKACAAVSALLAARSTLGMQG